MPRTRDSTRVVADTVVSYELSFTALVDLSHPDTH